MRHYNILRYATLLCMVNKLRSESNDHYKDQYYIITNVPALVHILHVYSMFAILSSGSYQTHTTT